MILSNESIIRNFKMCSMKFKLYNRIPNKYEMFCKFYNINNKKIVKTILFEYLENKEIIEFIDNNEFISIVFYFDRIELLAHYYKNNNYDTIELNKLVISVDNSSVIEKSNNHDEYNIDEKFINKMKSFENLIGQIEYDVVAIQFKRSEFHSGLLYCYLIHCCCHSAISSDFICHLDDEKADLFIKTANYIWK